MSATNLYEMTVDASLTLAHAKSRMDGLLKRYSTQLEDIRFEPILGNEASDFEEALRNGIDLLGDLIGMAEKAVSDIEAEGGPAVVDRNEALIEAAEIRRGK